MDISYYQWQRSLVNLFDENHKKLQLMILSYECIIGADVTVGTYVLPNLLKNINRINNRTLNMFH